jgi:hypothetical protein
MTSHTMSTDAFYGGGASAKSVRVGTMLVLYPGAGAEAITLLLSLYFIVAGTF